MEKDKMMDNESAKNFLDNGAVTLDNESVKNFSGNGSVTSDNESAKNFSDNGALTSDIKRKKIFSAVKPTGSMTLGNYVGAIKNWVAMQEDYQCFYCVADLHSITIELNAAEFRKNTLDDLALFMAFGLDPEKCTLFLQSHVPAHAELTWVLNCFTQFGEAKRMTQFKDKSKKAPENVNVGLFDYPVLMAADILLYQTDLVPVGQDQKQHVELARTIAQRFNSRYSPTFTLPEPYMPKHGAKIYSLTDPFVKMSKSDDNPNGYVLLLDKPEDIVRKFKRAVTDSDTQIYFDRIKKPGISNLLTIYATFADVSMAAAEREFENSDYAAFKARVGDAVATFLQPIQKEYARLLADKAYLNSVMQKGAEAASREAYKTLNKVYRKVGFIAR